MIYLPILYTRFARECAAPCFMARMNINERVRAIARIPHRLESGAPRPSCTE